MKGEICETFFTQFIKTKKTGGYEIHPPDPESIDQTFACSNTNKCRHLRTRESNRKMLIKRSISSKTFVILSPFRESFF